MRRSAQRSVETQNVIGIDDRAFRCGQRYSTLICDLEGRQGAVLLPDCESSTVETYLSAHPEIAILARGRGCYGEVAARALPNAIQVANHCWGGRSPNGIAVPS
jgi:hypothetical protein